MDGEENQGNKVEVRPGTPDYKEIQRIGNVNEWETHDRK